MNIRDKIYNDFLTGRTFVETVKRYDLPKEEIKALQDEAKQELKARAKLVQEVKLALPRHNDNDADKKWKQAQVRF